MIAVLLLLAQPAMAQGDLARGAKVFAQSCAVGYCHGTAGAANRGPRLAGRGFDRAFVEKVVRDGAPGTAMPGFKMMPAVDLSAVIAFVVNIAGGGSGGSAAFFEPSPEPPKFAGPPEAKRGKELFFDPVRYVRCGTCHAVEEWGAAIGPNLAGKPPASVDAIRNVKASLQTAIAGGESFPALLVDRKAEIVRVYDLTAPPPVLRTFAADEVRLAPSGSWSHAAVVASYKDDELHSVIAYLRWVSEKR